jgi:arylsulfatase A-like enzyme
MLRREFVKSLAAEAAAPAAERPNFIVIYTDDQGYGDAGCYGARDMKTPHIDRLAAAGARFTDWHSNSPVCSPSRASLLTGKYPHKAYVPQILFSRPGFDVPGLRKGERTLPAELKKLGYRTAAFGKWHLGSAAESRPMAQGFDEWFGFYSGWTDYYSHRYYTLGGVPVFHDLWRNGREEFRDAEYQTEMLAREAAQFIGRQKQGQPFMLYVAFGAPHYPMMAPEKYTSRFPQSMDRDRRMHCAVMAAVDDAVGSIVAAVEKAKLSNTVIFYQSDNGATREERADHAGRPYRGGSNAPWKGYKGSLWEGGHRLPGILNWKGRIPAGLTPQGMGMTIDIMPTFLKWAGGGVPDGVDGMDISDWVLRGGKCPREIAYWEYEGLGAVRRGDWKLLENWREGLGTPAEQGLWLANLKDDPAESRNLAAAEPKLVAELKSELDRWKGSLPPETLKPAARPGR